MGAKAERLICHAKWQSQGINLHAWVAGMPTDILKKLWDDDEIMDGDPGCFLHTAIYTEMNMRGEGGYVAI